MLQYGQSELVVSSLLWTPRLRARDDWVGQMTAEGYESQPLSDGMEKAIRDRLVWLKTERARVLKQPYGDNGDERLKYVSRLEGNIGALEWALREAENRTPAK